MSAWRWQSNWKVTLLVLVTLPFLIRLGLWQLERADEKRSLEALFSQRASLPPVSLQELNQHCDFEQGEDKPAFSCDPDQLVYRQLKLTGRYLNRFNALLDNQIEQGAPGYHVITPFRTNSGETFWINRGWIAAVPDRSLPAVPEAAGEIQLNAGVYLSQGESLVLGDDVWQQGWPVLIQAIDIDKLSAHQPLAATDNVFPYLLRLEPGFAGSLDIDWPLVNMKPQMHMGYAVQWFAMSIAVVAFWIYSSLKRVER